MFGFDPAEKIVDAEVMLQTAGTIDDAMCEIEPIDAGDPLRADTFEVTLGNVDVRRARVVQKIQCNLRAAVNVLRTELGRSRKPL